MLKRKNDLSNLKTRFVAVIIVLTVLFSASMSENKIKANAEISKEHSERRMNYLTTVLPLYSNLIGAKTSKFFVSDAFQITNGEDTSSYLYFISADGIVASITVCEKNGEFYSACKKLNDSNIVENKYIKVSRGSNGEAIIEVENLLSRGYKRLSFSNECNISESQTRTAQIRMINLSSYGPNTITIYEHGVCWAYVAAMLINHKDNSTITGTELCTELLSSPNYSYWLQHYGEFCGSVPWVREAYRLHGINIIDSASELTYNENYSLLGLNKPIHYDFYVSGTEIGHSVALCGSYYDETRLIYYFADPNEYDVTSGEDNDVTVGVVQNLSAYSNPGLIKFVSTGGTIYNECTHTYHY